MAAYQEKRNERREFLAVTVEYSLSFLENGALSCKTSEGITSNISKGGLSLYMNNPIGTGQDIKVFNNRIFEEPKIAFVRWCSKISDSIFKVGVKFA